MNSKTDIVLPIVCGERNDPNLDVINLASMTSEGNSIKKNDYKLIHPLISYSPASPKIIRASDTEMKLTKGSEAVWAQVSRKTSSTDKSTDSGFSKFACDTSLNLENPFSPGSECHVLDTEVRVEKLQVNSFKLGRQSLKTSIVKPKMFTPTLLKLDLGESETQNEISKNCSNVNTMTPLKWCKIEDVTKNEFNSSNIQVLSNCDSSEKVETSEETEPVLIMEDEPSSPTKSKSTVKPSKSSKLNKFQIRMDVVSKTIFRQIKAYYVSDFKKSFDFTKRRKRVNPNHSEEVYKRANEYIQTKFGTSKLGDMDIIFVALVDSKQKFSKIHSKYPELKSDINSLLRAFNMRKTESLLKLPEFSKLVMSYFEQPDCLAHILKGQEHPLVVEAYEKKVEELKMMCAASLNNF